jgi:orotate phosphoribosyltransferase
VRGHGGTVQTVVTIVDREEGASENLAREGVSLRALFRKRDFAA